MVWGEGVGVGVVSAAFEDRRQSYNGDIVVIAFSLSPKEKQRLHTQGFQPFFVKLSFEKSYLLISN